MLSSTVRTGHRWARALERGSPGETPTEVVALRQGGISMIGSPRAAPPSSPSSATVGRNRRLSIRAVYASAPVSIPMNTFHERSSGSTGLLSSGELCFEMSDDPGGDVLGDHFTGQGRSGEGHSGERRGRGFRPSGPVSRGRGAPSRRGAPAVREERALRVPVNRPAASASSSSATIAELVALPRPAFVAMRIALSTVGVGARRPARARTAGSSRRGRARRCESERAARAGSRHARRSSSRPE